MPYRPTYNKKYALWAYLQRNIKIWLMGLLTKKYKNMPYGPTHKENYMPYGLVTKKIICLMGLLAKNKNMPYGPTHKQ